MPPESLPSALARLARAGGNDAALCRPEGETVSYARLYLAVRALSRAYRPLAAVVGLLGPSGIPWALAYLGLLAAGKTVVPLPDFFSRDQLDHVVADAGVGHILADASLAEQARRFGVPASPIACPDGRDGRPADALGEGRLVIYTSGSTGRPKGVRIGPTQLAASALALTGAIGASADDTYLSILPTPLLLEQLCALHVALRAGARVVFGSGVPASGLADLVERVRPTVMVLVPELLAAWLEALAAADRTAPASLRFVAVGGAPVAARLAAAAWRRRIPVHEGYGLSECCAVVTLNRPGVRAAGTVGTPLDGLRVTIDDGEIVVRGPTVMDGYLNDAGARPGGVWRTGDLGAFDAAGRLIVHGRKDSLLVTPAGRNVVPEWIEALVTADPGLARCVLVGGSAAGPTAILVPHDRRLAAYQALTPRALAAHVAALVASAPAYARPARCLVVPDAELRRQGLLTDNGRPRRAAIERTFASARDEPTDAG